MRHLATESWSDFPALEMVRSSRVVRAVARVTVLILILFLIGMLFLPWRQTAPGTGIVLARNPQERPQSFKAPVKGIVRFVKPGLIEGALVEAGDILLELEPAAEGGVRELERQIETARQQLRFSEDIIEYARQQALLQQSSGEFLQQALAKEREAAQTKWEQAKSDLGALEAELVDKQNKRRIAEDVFQKGLVSREELVNKQQDEATQVQRVQKATQAVREAEATLAAKNREIDARLGEIEIKNREAENRRLAEQGKLESVRKELSELEIRRQELDRLTIRAPRTGYIQKWFGLEGSDTVKEGDQLFILVPQTSDMAVELVVSGNDIPLINVDDRVRLQFEGWPAVQFVGWPSVAVGTFGGKISQVFPTDDGMGNFRVLVLPDNQLASDDGWPDSRYLRQGARVNGWVLLAQVSLGFEVWRQINGFPPSLPAERDKGRSSVKPGPKLPKP